MLPGAASLLGRKDRHVARSYVRMDSHASRHRVTVSLEEALRLVDLPGEDEGRVYHFRRLDLNIPADASRAIWIECLQKALTILAQQAVHGADLASYNADAVFFRYEEEAFEVILRSALRPHTRPAWFWQPALGIAPASQNTTALPTAITILEHIREHRSPHSAAAILLAAIGTSDPKPLLSSLPTFTLREWIRSLEASGSSPAEARPIQLPEEIAIMLQSVATRFGWTDHRTLWLATQAVLSLSPPTQTPSTSVNRAQATLRHLQATHSQSPRTLTQQTDESHPSFPTSRPAIVFDEEPLTPPASGPSLSSPPPATTETPEPLPLQTHHRKPLRTSPLLHGEPTRFGGLYFLLHVLRHLGIATALEACPALVEEDFVARILQSLALHLEIAGDDEILAPLNTSPVHKAPFHLPPEARTTRELWPSTFHPAPSLPADGDYLVRLWTLAVRRWCWKTGRITARDIVTRPARVWLTRTDLDVTFPLSSADIRIRRIGLDVDPGWLPWFGPFGLVVRFHYRDRNQNDNPT